MSQSSDAPTRSQGANAGSEVELPRRGDIESADTQPAPILRNDDAPPADADAAHKQKKIPLATVDPSKLLDPIRTDPIKALELRKRRLDRQADSSMPEIHYIGQILSAKSVILDSTEGTFCR